MLQPGRRRAFVCSFLFVSDQVEACDLCGCYTPQLEAMPGMEPLFPWAKGWFGAVSEQFTHFPEPFWWRDARFRIRQASTKTVRSPNSSPVTAINDRFAFQLNIPLIYREFKRPEGFAIDRGTESGLGDISILLKTVAFKYSSGREGNSM